MDFKIDLRHMVSSPRTLFPTFAKPRSSTVAILGAILAVATFTVYLPVFELDFINFDDTAYVTGNPPVSGGLTWSGVVWAFRSFHSSNWHPLTWISHMLDCQLYGLRPGGHHLTNLLFHIANSLLVFWLLKGMTSALWRSAFVAGLFALHPLRVESVAWVAERKDVLSAFFGLLCLSAYVKFARAKSEIRNPKRETSPNSGNRSKHGYYWLALVLFAFGLMSKPMLVSWPFVMLLLDFWPLGRVSGVEGKGETEVQSGVFLMRSLFPLVVEKLPFFALTAASCVITFFAQREGGALVPIQGFPWVFRIENAVMSYSRYMGKLVYPHPLAVVYPKVPGWPIAEVLFASAILVVATPFALTRWRRGYVITGWFWFVVVLAPVIGLVKVGDVSMADRYMYLPAIGIFILLAWGMSDLTMLWTRRSIPLAIGAAGILIACAVATGRQIPYWQNQESLFEHALEVTGKNPLADINLGVYFMERGELNRAREHYLSAIAADPNFAESWTGLGYISAEEKKYDEAIADYESALRLKPGFFDARINFGKALFQVGQTNEAIEQFREAVRLSPSEAIGHYNLGCCLSARGDRADAFTEFRMATQLNPKLGAAWYNLGGLFAYEGKTDDAIATYRKGVEVEPGNVAARQTLGGLLLSAGRNQEAAREFSAVLQVRPDDSAAHYQLALALSAQGKSREAVKHYVRGLKSFEDIPAGLNNLAWILATCPDPQIRDGAKAVALAEKACSLTDYKEPILVGTLAAAYAEAGRFADAIAAAEKAHSLAEAAHADELAAKNAELLQLYRAGKPFRDVP